MTNVSVVKAKNYQSEEIRNALIQSLQLLDGIENIIKPRNKVFIKINHLSPPSKPDKAIVTHPLFTREVIRMLNDLQCEITVGDDVQHIGIDGYVISGYRKICQEFGVKLLNLKETGFKEVSCNGRVLDKTYISPEALNADVFINLPKLKTHSFTVFTGAIKNLYGIIPYGLRLHYHNLYRNIEIFSQMLVDIFSCAPSHLTIMDSIIGMEGEGPSTGKPREIGLIIASKDGVAVDAVASKIVGFNPLNIYTTLFAHQRGLGTGDLKEINLLGEPLQDIQVKDFKHSAIAVGLLQKKIPSFLYAYIQEQLQLIPEIIRAKCTSCKECIKICPCGAISLVDSLAFINKNNCIHCMCCHEVCRFQSIRLKNRPLGGLIRGIGSFYNKMKFLFPKKKTD